MENNFMTFIQNKYIYVPFLLSGEVHVIFGNIRAVI